MTQTQTPRLRWGILGTGNIATVFAKGLADSKTGALVAVGSRSTASAEAFGKAFGILQCHGSYEALLADPAVQAVYISMPHPLHAEWAIRAAEAGKHVLCEKPLGMNHAEATAIVEARAGERRLPHGGVHVPLPPADRPPRRTAPRTRDRRRAADHRRVLLQRAVRRQQPALRQRARRRRHPRRRVLPVSMARLVAGVAAGGTIAEPLEVRAVGRLGTTGVDEWSAVLRFPGDVIAQVSAGVAVEAENVVRIFGSEGASTCPSRGTPRPTRGSSSRARAGAPREITVDARRRSTRSRPTRSRRTSPAGRPCSPR